MNSTEKQLANLIPPKPENMFSKASEKAREAGRKGGLVTQERKKEQKTIAQYMEMWLNSSLSKDDKMKLEAQGLEGADTKKALLVMPLIKNLNKGDVKTYQMVMDLIGENTKREAEIERLKQENEKLRLEQEILKQELSGDGIDKIEILLDVPKVDND